MFHSDEGVSAQEIRRRASGRCYYNHHQTIFGALHRPVCSYVFYAFSINANFTEPVCTEFNGAALSSTGDVSPGASIRPVSRELEEESMLTPSPSVAQLEHPNIRSSALVSNNMTFKRNSQDGIAFNSYDSGIKVLSSPDSKNWISNELFNTVSVVILAQVRD